MTIVVGNVGAIGQSSLKRLLAYSSVAQAGYMLAGVVVTTQLGARAVVFYLAVYLFMNMAAFAVIVARERETGVGDDISSLYGLGEERPLLAWPMTIAMLALAGFPATAGFFGKVYLIGAAVDNGYAWLGVAIVLGSAISLAYYLRVVAAVWMRAPETRPALGRRRCRAPAIAGGSAEADPAEPGAAAVEERDRGGRPAGAAGGRGPRGGVRGGDALLRRLPEPLLDLAHDAGRGVDQSVLGASRRRRARATSRVRRPMTRCAPATARRRAEYVAILLVVAVAARRRRRSLWPSRSRASASAWRRRSAPASCIVGGDVCRSSDAAAAGLEPCVTRERSKRQDTTRRPRGRAARRARGVAARAALRRPGRRDAARGERARRQVGVGVDVQPGRASRRRRHRRARRRLPRRPRVALRRRALPPRAFLDRGDARRVRAARRARPTCAGTRSAGVPTARRASRSPTSRARGSAAGGRAARSGCAATARAGRSRSTSGSTSRGFSADLPGFPAGPGTQRSWVADVSWEDGAARELALRTATGDGERLEEHSARLDLREPGNRALAERLLRPAASTSADLARSGRERMRTTAWSSATATTCAERRRGFSVAGKLGLALGLAHHRITAERRLVDAVAWVRGGPPQRRFDCIGV